MILSKQTSHIFNKFMTEVFNDQTYYSREHISPPIVICDAELRERSKLGNHFNWAVATLEIEISNVPYGKDMDTQMTVSVYERLAVVKTEQEAVQLWQDEWAGKTLVYRERMV